VAEPISPSAEVRRVKIAPNGWAAAGGAGLMFALAGQTGSVWMQVVGAGLVGLLGVSWFAVVRRRGDVSVQVHRRVTVTVGESFEVSVHVRNKGKRASLPLRIRSELPTAPVLVAPVVVYVDPIAAGEHLVVAVDRVAPRRGAVLSSTLALDAIAPFGFYTSRRSMTHQMEFFAAPSAVSPLDLPRVLGAQLDGLGPMGPGLDVRGVREWRPGDAVRHVHWRSTARTGRLAVLDYGEPTVGTVGVLAAGTSGDPRFEAGVALAASTVMQTMSDGVAVVVPTVDRAASTHRVHWLTFAGWHRCFAEMGTVPVPRHETVDRLVNRVGSGGVVLLVVGAGVPTGFRDYVAMSAANAGVSVLDLAETSGIDRHDLSGR
jgi:uncharacterized protein (DUF58 family)